MPLWQTGRRGILARLQGELHEGLKVAIEKIEIDGAADALYAAAVGELPEVPRPLVAERLLVVMSYPQGIAVEQRRAEIVHPEPIAGIDDGRHAHGLLDNAKPSENIVLELGQGLAAPLLDVDHGRQVALDEVDLTEEKFGLAACVAARLVVVISPANKAVLARTEKVVVEVLIDEGDTLGGLHEDEAKGMAANPGITQFLPVDTALVVTDIDAHDLKPFGIVGFAINGTPAERQGTDKEMME